MDLEKALERMKAIPNDPKITYDWIHTVSEDYLCEILVELVRDSGGLDIGQEIVDAFNETRPWRR